MKAFRTYFHQESTKVRLVREGFSWGAFFFPWIWLLLRGLWIHSAWVLFFQISYIALTSFGDPTVAGILLLVIFVIRIVVGLKINAWTTDYVIQNEYIDIDVIDAGSYQEAVSKARNLIGHYYPGIKPIFPKLQNPLLQFVLGISALLLVPTILAILVVSATTIGYTNFIQAETTGSATRIAGHWAKEQSYIYDPATHIFSFYMRDEQNQVRQVYFSGAKPDCFEANQGLIVEGYSGNGNFIAEELLLKLPMDVADSGSC